MSETIAAPRHHRYWLQSQRAIAFRGLGALRGLGERSHGHRGDAPVRLAVIRKPDGWHWQALVNVSGVSVPYELRGVAATGAQAETEILAAIEQIAQRLLTDRRRWAAPAFPGRETETMAYGGLEREDISRYDSIPSGWRHTELIPADIA